MITTSNFETKLQISEAIIKGLPYDGGLYVPNSFPNINFEKYSSENDLLKLAREAMIEFFKGDVLENCIEEMVKKAFNFPIPLTFNPDGKCAYLELFHGPSASSKDFGARFLSYSLEALLKKSGKNLIILVATSGDEGSAVASAFYKMERIKVKILFPRGRVSPRQKKLLTVWGENIESYEVNGTFDDCQRMVINSIRDLDYMKYNLTSANSINIASLLPQMSYYVYSSILYKRKTGNDPIFIIPSANLGNSAACYYAREIGAPIKQIIIVQNANKSIIDYLETGEYKIKNSFKTLANGMDVGNPINVKRLFNLYPNYNDFKNNVTAYSVSDEQIKETIKSTYENEKIILSPESASAKTIYNDYFKGKNAIIVCTNHPGKFESIINDLIGVKPNLPSQLSDLLKKKEIYKNIGTDFYELFE